MSALLLVIMGWDAAPWERRFRAAAPGRDIRLWPDRVGDPADIAYAAAWLPPAGAFGAFKNLRAIFSLGAGVDARWRIGRCRRCRSCAWSTPISRGA